MNRGCYSSDLLPPLGVEPLNEVLHQEGNVFAPFAQRRQGQTNNGESEIEVVTELPFTHELGQLGVRRGHDPNIAACGLDSTKRFVFPLLKNSEQLHLGGRRQLGDLVEEDGPALGQSQPARFVPFGIRESTLLVAEKLRLEKIHRKRTAIDRYERSDFVSS